MDADALGNTAPGVAPTGRPALRRLLVLGEISAAR
jgi:hypothetical protein